MISFGAWDAIWSHFWSLFSYSSPRKHFGLLWSWGFHNSTSHDSTPTMMCLEQSRFSGSWFVKIRCGDRKSVAPPHLSSLLVRTSCYAAFFSSEIKRIVPLTTIDGCFPRPPRDSTTPMEVVDDPYVVVSTCSCNTKLLYYAHSFSHVNSTARLHERIFPVHAAVGASSQVSKIQYSLIWCFLRRYPVRWGEAGKETAFLIYQIN